MPAPPSLGCLPRNHSDSPGGLLGQQRLRELQGLTDGWSQPGSNSSRIPKPAEHLSSFLSRYYLLLSFASQRWERKPRMRMCLYSVTCAALCDLYACFPGMKQAAWQIKPREEGSAPLVPRRNDTFALAPENCAHQLCWVFFSFLFSFSSSKR